MVAVDAKKSQPQKMELLALTASPYSRRVKWALQVQQVPYGKLPPHQPISGELGLRWKLGRWWGKATVPVAFITNKEEGSENSNIPAPLILDHGTDIVEWADEQAKIDHRLVPPAQRTEILEMCRLADEIQQFGRTYFSLAACDDPSLMREFVGPEAPNAILPVIANVSYMFFSCKYAQRYTLEETRDKLDGLQQIIQNKQQAKDNESSSYKICYLVGDQLTLADLYVCVAICGGPLLPERMEEDAKKEAALTKVSGLDTAQEFPILLEWSKTMVQVYGVPAKMIW